MKRGHVILASFGAAAAVAVLVLGAFVYSLGPAPLGEDLEYSHVVLDRNGKLLRAYATSEGRWRLPETEKNVDPRFIKLLFAYEDKRFRTHHGVDPDALLRAAFQFATNGHIVSGGSTLTMQVARLLEPREHRTMTAKLRQIVRAFELERALSKTQMLALYLSLAPYGGNLEGIRAASLAYFGKEPRKLTLGEAALLVALPQSPELRRPDRFPERARAARDRVLDRAAEAGAVPRDEIARAKAEAVPHERKPLPVLAPHAADQVVAAEPDLRIHRLTIDADLQRSLEELARERARALGPQISVAILAVDNATGEVSARVASADYFDARRAGQVDMTQALRSPGSTLKPFIYGLGFEDGLIHPETLIDDRPVRYRQLYAGKFRSHLPGHGHRAPRAATLAQRSGDRRARQGRRQSPERAAGASGRRAGAAERRSAGSRHGPRRRRHQAHRSGDALCRARARGQRRAAGRARGCSARSATAAARFRRRLVCRQRADRRAAAGERRRPAASPSRPAPRTAIATPGRSASTAARPSASGWGGRTARRCRASSAVPAAAPILFDAFARSGHALVPLPPAPKGAIFATTNRLPPPLQRFRPDGASGAMREPPRIMFPPDGARLELSGRRQAGQHAAEDRRRRRAADGDGQWRAAAGA